MQLTWIFNTICWSKQKLWRIEFPAILRYFWKQNDGKFKIQNVITFVSLLCGFIISQIFFSFRIFVACSFRKCLWMLEPNSWRHFTAKNFETRKTKTIFVFFIALKFQVNCIKAQRVEWRWAFCAHLICAQHIRFVLDISLSYSNLSKTPAVIFWTFLKYYLRCFL